MRTAEPHTIKRDAAATAAALSVAIPSIAWDCVLLCALSKAATMLPTPVTVLVTLAAIPGTVVGVAIQAHTATRLAETIASGEI